MTKSKKYGLVAALIFFGSSLLPWSSCGAQNLLVGGTYVGINSWQISTDQNGVETDSSGSGSAIFTFADYSDGQPIVNFYCPSAPEPLDQFGLGVSMVYYPTSAQGGVDASGGPGGFTASFSLTYESIMPDGEIVIGDGVALFDFEGNSGGSPGNGSSYSMEFTGAAPVPEPSSIVQATLALLTILIFAWIRGTGPRRWLRPS